MKHINTRLLVFFILSGVIHLAVLLLGSIVYVQTEVAFPLFPFNQLTVSGIIYLLAHGGLLVTSLFFLKRIKMQRVKLRIMAMLLVYILGFYVIHAGLLYLSASRFPEHALSLNIVSLAQGFLLFLCIQGIADIPFRLATSYLNQRVNLTKAALFTSSIQAMLIITQIMVFAQNTWWVVALYAFMTLLVGILSSYLYFAFKNIALIVFTRTLFFTFIGYALASYQEDYVPYVIVVILLGASINALNKNVHFIRCFEPL